MRLIDADAIIEFERFDRRLIGEGHTAEDIIMMIQTAPTITPESLVRHGRWIWKTNALYPKPVCSRCSEEPWRRSNHQSDLPNYCPKCGAKMDQEDKQ